MGAMTESRRRIIIASRSDMTRDNRSRKMSASLAAAGWEVLRVGLLTSARQPQADEDAVGPIFRVRTTTQFAADKPTASTADAVPLPAMDGGVAPARASAKAAIRDALGRYRDARLYAREIAERSPTAVIVQNADLGPLVPMLRRRGIPVIFDARELWTEMEPRAHPVYKRLFGWYERMAWRRASGRIAVNSYIGEELARRHGAASFSAVHNGPDTCHRDIRPVGEPVRLFFQGAFAPDRNPDLLVRAMVGLEGMATLTMQGFGALEPVLHELVAELGLSGVVHFIEPCAPSEVVESAAGYDIGIVPNRPTSLNLLYSSPNKFFDYLGGGLALAVAEIPFMADAVRRFACGAVLDMSDATTLGAGLREMVEDREGIAHMKQNAVRACGEFAWDRQAEVLIALCDRVTSGPGGGSR